MNYVHLKPATRAAETEPTVDVDLFEDRGIPVDLMDLVGQGFAMEGYDDKGKIEGAFIWCPGLSFEDITSSQRTHEKVVRSTGDDDPDEDGL